MLTNQERREIAEAVLNEEIGGMMFRFEDMDEVNAVHDAVVITRSAMGYIANGLYDSLLRENDNYNDFVKAVFTEIEDEYFRLMMMCLYNVISIEHVLDQYILNLFDQH